jgi:hypothetical protein
VKKKSDMEIVVKREEAKTLDTSLDDTLVLFNSSSMRILVVEYLIAAKEKRHEKYSSVWTRDRSKLFFQAQKDIGLVVSSHDLSLLIVQHQRLV